MMNNRKYFVNFFFRILISMNIELTFPSSKTTGFISNVTQRAVVNMYDSDISTPPQSK